MKKNILLILILLLIVCGCSEKNNAATNDRETNSQKQEVLTKEQIFKEQAIKIYGNYELTKENVNYYVTPLSAILRITTGYELTFKGCIEDETYMSYDIYEEGNEIKTNLRFVFVCDGKSETYFYEGLDDEEPIIY